MTKADPVLPDQGGRMMPVDPSPPASESREDLVRRRAYEIYERRGREPGRALEHWLAAEQEMSTKHKTRIDREEFDVALPNNA